MRLIGKAAIAMAIVTLTAMVPISASAEETGHRIAVVDVAYIFKNHPGHQISGFKSRNRLEGV